MYADADGRGKRKGSNESRYFEEKVIKIKSKDAPPL